MLGPLAASANAQESQWYNQDLPSWYNKVYDNQNPAEIFGERYTAAQVQWIMYAIPVNIMLWISHNNSDLVACILGTVNNCGPGIQKLQGSTDIFTIPKTDKSLLALIFEDRPLSGVTYVKDTFRKFHIIPEAHAQDAGFGFNALSIIRDAWASMRNIVFGLFIFVIIIFALMIMFKVKISPQAVITVQSAIPKIAITLLAITFSYAIAGFLIDMMYVFIGIVALVFSNLSVGGFGNDVTPAGYFDLLTKGPNVLNIGVHTGIFGFLLSYWINFFVAMVMSLVLFVATDYAKLLNIPIGARAAGLLGGDLIHIVYIIVALFLFIFLLFYIIYAFFKIILMLLKTFAIILLLTIFAPFYLLLGMISPAFSLSNWIRTLAAKLAVFPTVGAVFLLAFWFLGLSIQVIFEGLKGQIASISWGPDFAALFHIDKSAQFIRDFGSAYADGWPPLIGGMPETMGLILLIVSLVVLFQSTKAAEMVEGIIAGKGFSFESAIGEASNIFGVRRFATGVGTEALGEYVGRRLYDSKTGRGAIPGLINRVRTSKKPSSGGRGTPPISGTTGPTVYDDDYDY